MVFIASHLSYIILVYIIYHNGVYSLSPVLRPEIIDGRDDRLVRRVRPQNNLFENACPRSPERRGFVGVLGDTDEVCLDHPGGRGRKEGGINLY